VRRPSSSACSIKCRAPVTATCSAANCARTARLPNSTKAPRRLHFTFSCIGKSDRPLHGRVFTCQCESTVEVELIRIAETVAIQGLVTKHCRDGFIREHSHLLRRQSMTPRGPKGSGTTPASLQTEIHHFGIVLPNIGRRLLAKGGQIAVKIVSSEHFRKDEVG
jgi:hypothetical protein